MSPIESPPPPMGSGTNQNQTLSVAFVKVAASVCAVLSFVADMIAIVFFTLDLFEGKTPLASSTSISRVLIILTFFAFGLLLYIYSHGTSNKIDSLVWLFSWMYITYAAFILGYQSWWFLRPGSIYGFLDYFAFFLLSLGMIAIGSFLCWVVGQRMTYFAVPFMIVAMEQIFIWTWLIFSSSVTFNWTFAYNFAFFIYISLVLIFFISVESPTLAAVIQDMSQENQSQDA